MNSVESQLEVILKKFYENTLTEDQITQISRKAAEYNRLLNIRAPTGLGNGQVCRNYVILDLASSQLKIELEVQPLISICGTTFDTYCQTYSTARAILKLDPLTCSAHQLAQTFRYPQYEQVTQQMLDLFVNTFLEQLEPEQRQFAKFENPVFCVVAFWWVLRLKKKPIDKNRLLLCFRINGSDFRNVEKSFLETLELDKQKKKAKKPSGTKPEGTPNMDKNVNNNNDTPVNDSGADITRNLSENETLTKRRGRPKTNKPLLNADSTDLPKNLEEKEKESKNWIQKMREKPVFTAGKKQSSLEAFLPDKNGKKKAKVENEAEEE